MTTVMIPVSVLDLIVRVTILLLLGAGLAALLKRVSASLRHVVWVSTLVGTLALAVATPLVPRVPVPVPWLPAPAGERDAFAASPPATTVAAPVTRLDTPLGVTASSSTSPSPRVMPVAWRVAPWLALWLAGALLVLARLALGRFGLSRLERRARPVTDPAWLALLADTRVTSGVIRPVRLAVSERVGAPITWGLGRAVILLPADADRWTVAQRRDVLMHELAHVARRDALTLHLSMLACAVYWFHPGVWMAARRLRTESEMACDDRVLAAGTPAYDYAALLLSVARAARALRLSGVAAIGMARRSTLEGRLLAVLDHTADRGRVTARAHALAMLALAVPLAALAAASPVARPAHVVRPTVAVASTPAPDVTPAPSASAALLAAATPKPAQPSGASTTTTGVSEFERSLKASPGERLTLELDAGGEVTVKGWDEARVLVRVKLAGKDWRDETVEIRRETGGVLVASTYPEHHGSHSSSDSYDIRVPRRFDVHLSSAGGPFMAADLDGRLDGHTGGGEVTLKHLTGSAHLSTGGGEIRVDDADLSGSVSTGGGAVTLSRVRGGLRGSSGSGPVVYTDSPAGEGTGDLGDADVDEEGRVSHLVETRTGAAGMAHVTRAGGDVTLDEAPGGAVVATGGGDVTVGRSAGLVQASTGGGDIEVGPVAGSVEAGTGAGDVHVILAKTAGRDQTVKVTSGSGKVRLDLPRDFDGVLELETAYTEDFGHATTIVTPGSWSVKRQSTTQWDDSEGSPRKYVRASGTIGKGGGKVRVKTVNGDIEVRIAP